MTFPAPDAWWPEIDRYLRSRGIRINNASYGETEGGGHVAGSEHYQHRARDYPTSSCDAPTIARALEPFARGPNAVIDELFYSGTRTWYDNGNYFVPAPGAIEYRNHFSHVHAGIRRGALLPSGSPPPPPPVKPPAKPQENELKGLIIQCDINANQAKNAEGWHFAICDPKPVKWHVPTIPMADFLFAAGHAVNNRPTQVPVDVYDFYATI